MVAVAGFWLIKNAITSVSFPFALTLIPCFLFLFGLVIASFQIRPSQELTWPGFIWLAADVALLPLIMPPIIMAVGLVAGGPIAYLTSRWFGLLSGITFGVEFGLFGVVLALPVFLFAWPVFCRMRSRPNSKNSKSTALKPFVVFALFGGLTIAAAFTLSSKVLLVAYVVSWILFYAAYRRWVYSRLPRFA